MIGNDVIDLTAARTESNWRRRGFMDKLFSQEEQALVTHSNEPEITVWLLWSMKEAAYKIYNRETGRRGFFPLRLKSDITSYGSHITGKVYCEGRLYFTHTVILNDTIHTVAVTDIKDFDKIKEGSAGAVVKDVAGLPYIGCSPASVSHHGKVLKVVYIPNVIPAVT